MEAYSQYSSTAELLKEKAVKWQQMNKKRFSKARTFGHVQSLKENMPAEHVRKVSEKFMLTFRLSKTMAICHQENIEMTREYTWAH